MLTEGKGAQALAAAIREYLDSQDHGICAVRQDHTAACNCGLDEARIAAGMKPRPRVGSAA